MNRTLFLPDPCRAEMAAARRAASDCDHRGEPAHGTGLIARRSLRRRFEMSRSRRSPVLFKRDSRVPRPVGSEPAPGGDPDQGWSERWRGRTQAAATILTPGSWGIIMTRGSPAHRTSLAGGPMSNLQSLLG